MAKRRNSPSAVDAASQLDRAPTICANEVLLRNGGKIVLESTDSASELNLEAERAQVAPYLARVGAWFEAEFGQRTFRDRYRERCSSQDGNVCTTDSDARMGSAGEGGDAL